MIFHTYELQLLQALVGKLKYIGHGILPPAELLASRLQYYVGELRVSHLTIANNELKSIQKLMPSLFYNAPAVKFDSDTSHAFLIAFSEASTGSNYYRQNGYISGLLLPTGGINLFHPLDWHSLK